jgi:hypothetical protein
MIRTPRPFHTHVGSLSYIYEVFQHLILWPVVIRTQPQPDICMVSQSSACRQFSRFLTCNVLKVMIRTPHPFHTHIGSLPYIYKDFQHLILWHVVIRMQPQPDMLGLTVKVLIGNPLGFSLAMYCRL